MALRFVASSLLAMFAVTAGHAGGQDVKKDLELLQGTWNMDSIEWGGKSLPKDLMTGYKFVFAGNKLTWDGATGMMSKGGKVTAVDGKYSGDFKIDPSKNPKQIDMTLHLKSKQGNRDVTLLGIYEIKGDTLKICNFSSSTGKRPVEFSQRGKDKVGFIVLTRAKKPAAVRLPGDKDAAKKNLELLQGTWNMDSIEWSGASLPKELMTGHKFVFAGNKLTWKGAMGVMSRAGNMTAIGNAVYPCDFKIDPGQEPKQIDITLHLEKVRKGTGDRTILGIYEIKGDTLKLCYFTSNNGRRPVEFSQRGKDKVGFIVLTRAKK